MDLNLRPSETLDTLGYNNSFHLVGQGTPNLRTLEPGQKRRLARLLCGAGPGRGAGIIYTRHLYYTNFTQHGCNVSYFNMVSDSDVTGGFGDGEHEVLHPSEVGQGGRDLHVPLGVGDDIVAGQAAGVAAARLQSILLTLGLDLDTEQPLLVRARITFED